MGFFTLAVGDSKTTVKNILKIFDKKLITDKLKLNTPLVSLSHSNYKHSFDNSGVNGNNVSFDHNQDGAAHYTILQFFNESGLSRNDWKKKGEFNEDSKYNIVYVFWGGREYVH